MRVVRLVRLPLLVLLIAAGCRGTGRLAEYDFRERSLAVAVNSPPRPAVLTGPYFIDTDGSPIRTLIRLGTTVAKEVEAAKVRPRLDSAVARGDAAGRMAARTLERAARHMRTRPVENERDADFILDIRLRKWGIDAESWQAAAHFFIEADVFLVGARDGGQIWRIGIKERTLITPVILGSSAVLDVVTAATLANLSVDEIARALDHLADYSADVVTDHLRDALEKVQRR